MAAQVDRQVAVATTNSLMTTTIRLTKHRFLEKATTTRSSASPIPKTTSVAFATAALRMIVAAVAVTIEVPTIEEMVTTWREEEEDKKGKLKKSPFSKQVGVVLESENKFFLRKKEGDPKLLGEKVECLFF